VVHVSLSPTVCIAAYLSSGRVNEQLMTNRRPGLTTYMGESFEFCERSPRPSRSSPSSCGLKAVQAYMLHTLGYCDLMEINPTLHCTNAGHVRELSEFGLSELPSRTDV
jgi:hypothetical protein